MKKKDSKQGGKKNRSDLLSEEDLALWQHMARTLRPFHGRNARITPSVFDEAPFEPHGSPSEVGREKPEALPAPPQPPPAIPASRRHPHSGKHLPSLADIDSRKARKIRSGRIDIEAKLDLHGMRQSEAHSRLRAFLFRAQARRLKWVLVITGKGTFARDQATSSGYDDWDGPQRGILRRNVPMWLAEPDMRAVVVGFTTAAIHHGGEGAIYVQIRSRK